MMLITEYDVCAELGLTPDEAFYQFANKHKLPIVNIGGRLFVESRDLEQWRAARASEARGGASGVPPAPD